MLRAVKIRLYPNVTQAIQINRLLGCYRVVYNQCLNRFLWVVFVFIENTNLFYFSQRHLSSHQP